MKLNNHEEIFISLYSRLRGWAIQIARQDKALAEDLLHDAFIQFISSQPELQKIINREAYLYGLIRNLHLSHIRKKVRRDKHTPSIIDFETLRLGLKSARLLDDFQVQEELKRICYFLCLRKESSKSASVMILRFFHGYFPGEIAKVMRAAPPVVKVRLNTARNEARAVIENSETIQAIEKRISPEIVIEKSFRTNVELALALGDKIFRSTNGTCLSVEELNEIYLFNENETIETKTLAHIVSCRKCIDKVNEMLGLLPISDRHSVDFIGKDNNGSGDSSGNGGGMNEDLNKKVLLKLRRGAQEVFEHDPRELFLAINGEPRTSQKIEDETTELMVGLDETPEFIEIFSEQNVRLAFLSLTEDTEGFNKLREFGFDLSDGRKLCIKIKKESSGLIVRAEYENPHLADARQFTEVISEDLSFDEFLRGIKAAPAEARMFGALLDSRKNEDSFGERLKKYFSFLNFKTAFAAGSLAALVIGALFVSNLYVPAPNVSAAEIIQKTVAAEQSAENDTEKILRRVIDFEEKSPDGAVLKRRRIEIFNDAARKLSVRRLFDENNRLIAGEWRRKDGVSTTYAVEKMSELRFVQTDRDIINQDLENIWQLSVSAKGFESIVSLPENAAVENVNGEYRLNYGAAAENGITKAALIINRNLRAEKMFLTVTRNNATREFSFTEAVFEQKPSATVEKAVFEPNPEFLKTAALTGKTNPEAIKPEKLPDVSEATKESLTAENSSAAGGATPELEVKVLQLLNQVNALSGEQINITKTPAGKIQIRGIVDAKQRRDEILGALAEMRGNPAVSVNIQTAEEASKNKSSQKTDGTLESITVESRNSIPAGDALRDYFSAQGVADERIEAEIRRFASGALAKSSQVRRSALQLKQIAERFSAAELEKMDETAKTNWRRLIKQNAASVAQNAESLRGDLRGALNIAAGNSGGGGVNTASDAELARAAKRLFELSTALDRDVRASFSAGGTRGAVPAKSAAFASSLAEIIGLAKQLR